MFVPDRDTANSADAISDRELFASKCLCLGTVLANLASYVILKCIGNTFEKITCDFSFYKVSNDGNNKTHGVYGKDCYIIKDNVIIDEPDFDANKLYQIVFR